MILAPNMTQATVFYRNLVLMTMRRKGGTQYKLQGRNWKPIFNFIITDYGQRIDLLVSEES